MKDSGELQLITLVAYVLLVILAIAPLAFAWSKVIACRRIFVRHPYMMMVPMFVATASGLLFLVGLYWQQPIGGDYTGRRFVTIYTNLLLSVGVTALSIAKRHEISLQLAVLGVCLMTAWLYMAAVSSVV